MYTELNIHFLISSKTGQGVYQDPSSTDHQQAPTGDLYALPEKKGSRRQAPSAPKDTPTYQDPGTIQRQQAPTGDMYAEVNEKNKVSNTIIRIMPVY